jgi:hypothetical protein
MKSATDKIEWISQRHAYWCQRLYEFSKTLGVTPRAQPTMCVYLPGKREAGHYSSLHGCAYSLAYAMSEDEFDSTIAHEVCHAYQKSLMPDAAWHGEFFLFLLQVVCGKKAHGTRHKYNVKRARAFGRLLVANYRCGLLSHPLIYSRKRSKTDQNK